MNSTSTALTELQFCKTADIFAFRDLYLVVRDLDSNSKNVAEDFERDYGGLKEENFSIVPAIEKSPAEYHMHVRDVKTQLLLDVEPPQGFYTIPISNSACNAAQATQTATDLVESLGEEYYCSLASVAVFSCPVLGKAIAPRRSGPSDEHIFPQQFDAYMFIMGSGSIDPLEYSGTISCSEIHLLTGTRVYFIWPSTEFNMAIFQAHLDDPTILYMRVCQELERSIALVQHPGHSCFIPPHCPTVVFATKNSAAVTYYFRRIAGLPQQMRYKALLPDQVLFYYRGNPGSYAQLLQDYIEQLLEDLKILLWETDPSLLISRYQKTIHLTGKEWDNQTEHLGIRCRELVDHHTSGIERRRIQIHGPMLWASTLGLFDRCTICSIPLKQIPLPFRDHFIQRHWYGTTKTKKRKYLEAEFPDLKRRAGEYLWSESRFL
jgi:hypothetical protein